MWKYDSVDNSWYRRVTSGFLVLTFIIREEAFLYVLRLLENRSSCITLCTDSIEMAKQNANAHIKHALRWA